MDMSNDSDVCHDRTKLKSAFFHSWGCVKNFFTKPKCHGVILYRFLSSTNSDLILLHHSIFFIFDKNYSTGIISHFYSLHSSVIMKKLLPLLLFMGLFINAQAQEEMRFQKRDAYFGIGTGLESFSGLIGLTADMRITEKLFIRGGAGIGNWGYKLSAGIRTEKKTTNSVGCGVFVSYATGLNDFTTSLETTSGNKDVKLDLHPVMTLTPEIFYKWLFGRGHRFFISGGYSVPLKTSNWWEVRDGSDLTATSKDVLNIMAPGGLSLGFGFQFVL